MAKKRENTVPRQAVTPVKKKRRVFRWVLLLLLIPVIYIAIQLAIIFTPNMRYETALPDTMMDSITVPGFLTMDAQPVTGGGGTLYYTVPQGERVVAGGEVAKVFASESGAAAWAACERIDTEHDQLETASKILAEGGDINALAKQKLNGVYELIEGLESQNYANLDEPKAEIMLAANKMAVVTGLPIHFDERIAELAALRESYAAQAAVEGIITAPASGYFVPSPKFDRVLKQREPLVALNPAELQALLREEPEYYDADVMGHIVADYRWSFFAVVEARDAVKFLPGGKLQVAFSDYSETLLPVTVQTVVVDESAGLAKIELLCEYMNAEVLQMRCEKAKIIFKTEKGLRVDKNALRLINGETGVYIKYGNMVYFRRILILQKDDHYLLVSTVKQDGVSELLMYDEVIVDAGGVVLENEKIL